MFKNVVFRLLFVMCGLAMLGSCGKGNNKSAVKAPPKDSTLKAPDSTIAGKDSAGKDSSGKDSSQASDTTHSVQDSSKASKDTAGGQDSSKLAAIPEKVLSYHERQGKYLYAQYCSVCHGVEGKGDGFNAFNLDPKPRNFAEPKWMDGMSDERLVQTIHDGGRVLGKSPLMPAWGGTFNPDEITYLVSYVRLLAADTSSTASTPANQ